MPYRVYLVEEPTLLEDLLEDSARRYHRHCAVIQRVFQDQWLETLAEEIERHLARRPHDDPAAVEAQARERLRPVRRALREAQRQMIHEEADARAARDRAIHAYVESLEYNKARVGAA